MLLGLMVSLIVGLMVKEEGLGKVTEEGLCLI